MSTISKPLVVYIPDTRGVVISRFGKGNLKIGLGVYTYSRLPGHPTRPALGSYLEGKPANEVPLHVAAYQGDPNGGLPHYHGTCPGSTPECEAICYARRPVAEDGPVMQMWRDNTYGNDVPEIPEDAKLLRLHVGGDFNSVEYIANWYHRLAARPDVTAWVYTRSWRVFELLAALERLRTLPNVQMFASMDLTTPEMPPSEPYCSCGAPPDTDGQMFNSHAHDCVLNDPEWQPWRRAWIDGDPRAGKPLSIPAHSSQAERLRYFELTRTEDGTKNLICPEETKAVANCEECGYCIDGRRNDVTFLKH